jgi:hypothetical protein
MEIFLSYSSNDENIANTVSNMFDSIKHHGIELIRDKDSLRFMQDIKKFMQSIRDRDYALLIISDSFLKSNNCMYEITELIKEENYKNKILVLVDKSTQINNIKIINDYLVFWQDKCKELKDEILRLEPVNQANTIDELRKSENIKLNISNFLRHITNLKLIYFNNNITIDDFEEIKKYLGIANSNIKPNDAVYYVMNIPRTLSERNFSEGNTILWWHKVNGYTEDLREAKIFSENEVKELIVDNNNWGNRKFAAIPADIVASLENNVIPMSGRFLERLKSNNDRIIGNRDFYLEKDEISSLI